MTDPHNLFWFLLTAFAGWILLLFKPLKEIVTFLEDRWLSPQTTKTLSAKFEAWWFEVDAMKPGQFAVVLVRKTSDVLDALLGKAIFSWHGFKRGSKWATVFLLGLLIFFGLIGQGVNPIAQFTSAVGAVKSAPSKAPAQAATEGDHLKQWAAVAERLDNGVWKYVYGMCFYAVVFGGNLAVFFLSFALADESCGQSQKPMTCSPPLFCWR